MNRFSRFILGCVGMCVVAVVASPPSSSAWHQKELSSSTTGVPNVMVLNEDQLKGKWKQFKGELKGNGATLRTMTSCTSREVATSLKGKSRSATELGRMK